MNNIAPKLQKYWTHKIAFKIIIKNTKATKFLSQSAFYTSKGSTCKVLPFYNFWFKLMISCVAPTRSSTFYAYLITKIGNCNLKVCLKRNKLQPSLQRSLEHQHECLSAFCEFQIVKVFYIFTQTNKGDQQISRGFQDLKSTLYDTNVEKGRHL